MRVAGVLLRESKQQGLQEGPEIWRKVNWKWSATF